MNATKAAASSALVFRGKYLRGLEISTIVIVAGWQIAGAGVQLATSLSGYSAPGVEIVAWTVQAVIIAAGSVLLLRGSVNTRLIRGLVAADVAAGVAAMAACTPSVMLSANWAWGTVVWIGVLLLLYRPVRELVALIAVTALMTFSALVAAGDLDRRFAAGFISTLYASASIQLAVVFAARALVLAASHAATAAEEEAAVVTRHRIAEAVHTDRQARSRTVRARNEPLLAGLASGSLHPDTREVQQMCAIEAARLRRMFAESDDVPDRLLHELQACADVADRRGVAMDWATSGTIPQIPASVRRELTDAALSVLATASVRARVTVTAGRHEVAVCLFCDPDAQPPPAVPGLQIQVTSQRDASGLWVEARWHARLRQRSWMTIPSSMTACARGFLRIPGIASN